MELWSEGVHWGVTGLVDRKRSAVYGLRIRATKDSDGVIRWCEVPLYGDAEIEGAKIVEAIDSMEGITIPERYQILEIPECIEQPKASFGLTRAWSSYLEWSSNNRRLGGDYQLTLRDRLMRSWWRSCRKLWPTSKLH